MKNRVLGRGLDELFGSAIAPVRTEGDVIIHIRLDDLQPNEYQPRKHFDDNSLYELSDSIKRSGVIQPIIAYEINDGKYNIIAGERRFRASKMAGLDSIPAIVKKATEEELLEWAMIENIQREDLGVIEEAEGYLVLMERFKYTQEELSKILGKSRPHIANILRMNKLPESVKDLVRNKRLSMGQAKVLVGHSSAEEIASTIVGKGLNSRQAEHLAKNWGKADKFSAGEYRSNSGSDLDELVSALSQKFGMKITIENTGAGGKVTFYFANLEQLDSILTKLN